MATAAECMTLLDEHARELDTRSKELAATERDLEPVEAEYRKFVDDFEIGLWQRSQDEEGFKLPSEALRLKLAHRSIDPAVLGRYVGLVKRRRRLEQRLRDLKAAVDAQRSILSALKTEMDAVGHR